MKLPIIQAQGQRGVSMTKDDILINCYAEQLADGRTAAVKRPGVASYQAPAPASTPRGLWYYNSTLISVYGNKLFRGATEIGSDAITGSGPCWAVEVGTNTKYLVITNGTKGWILNSSWTLFDLNDIAVASTSWSSPNITYTTASGAHNFVAGNKVTVTGMSPSEFNVVGNAVGSVSSTTVVLDPSGTSPSGDPSDGAGFISPAGWQTHVHGIVHLDGYVFTLSSAGQVAHSGVRNPWDWDPLNVINAESFPDGGVALVRHLNYIAAFGSNTLEFFYDAANTTGSVLSRVSGALIPIGCANARTIASLKEMPFFLSDAGAIYMLSDMKPTRISTPPIERIIAGATLTDAFAQTFEYGGHSFYMLTLPTTNVSLAYDVTTQRWWQAMDPSGNYWPYVNALQVGMATYFQRANGSTYTLSGWQDAGSNYTMSARTAWVDFGTGKHKILRELEVLADVGAGDLSVRYSKDDFANWSTARTASTAGRINMRNFGDFRRIAFEFSHTHNEAMRLFEVELDVAGVAQ